MFIEDDGIRLSAVLEKPDRGDGPLVILLHGFTSSKDRLHNVQAAQAMREAGYATLRIDLYGHGESGGEFRKHTLYKWISNTLAAIDAAREMGCRDLYLSGHSQGGLVAALAAGMETDRVSGLVLRAPAFMIPRGAREGMLLGTAFDPDHIPEEIPVADGLFLDGNYIRVAQTIRVEEAIARFRKPVLILHGTEDDTVPPEDSVRAAGMYEQCELGMMQGETHHFDRYPEEMCRRIREWLAARAGS